MIEEIMTYNPKTSPSLDKVQDRNKEDIDKLNARIDKMAQHLISRDGESSYTSSTETALLDGAFAKAQAEFIRPVKSKKGAYAYYSTPEDLLKSVLPALNKYGIGLRQPVVTENGKKWIYIKIKHSSGQWEQVKFQLIDVPVAGNSNPHQVLGGSITYMKRYCLSSYLGIGGADETDLDDHVEEPEVLKTSKKSS